MGEIDGVVQLKRDKLFDTMEQQNSTIRGTFRFVICVLFRVWIIFVRHSFCATLYYLASMRSSYIFLKNTPGADLKTT